MQMEGRIDIRTSLTPERIPLHDALLWYSRRTTAGFDVIVESAAPGTRRSKYRALKLDVLGLDDGVPNGRDGSTASEGDRAAACKGGHEVLEGAKIRFTINCQFPDNWYFYIITVDRSSEDKLQLYFPKFVGDKTRLLAPGLLLWFKPGLSVLGPPRN